MFCEGKVEYEQTGRHTCDSLLGNILVGSCVVAWSCKIHWKAPVF